MYNVRKRSNNVKNGVKINVDNINYIVIGDMAKII